MKAASRNRSIRLVIIDSDPRARAYVRSSFADRDVRVVGEADDVKSGMRFVRGLVPDVVLIELPENASETMDALRTIRDELPEIGVIVSRHDPTPQLILSGLRSGAQEFVSRPIDFPELERAIEHVRRVMLKTSAPAHKRGSVISVFSGKGGIGASSVAANLAVALAGNSDAKTALVDLSFQIGDLGLMLDEPPRYSLIDALSEGRLDESRLRSVLTQHDCGVNLLTVAASPELGEEITRHHMIELFGMLTAIFDFVVVDVGRQLDDRTAEVLDLSDEILMLCTLDIPSIRNASRYLDVFQKMELDRERFRLVINRFHKKTRLAVKDAEAALGMPVFWTIPNDFEPMSVGIDSGAPAVLNSRRSKVAKSLKELAALLCRHDEEEPSADAAEVRKDDVAAAPAAPTPAPIPVEREAVAAPRVDMSEFVNPELASREMTGLRRADHSPVTGPRIVGNYDVNAS